MNTFNREINLVRKSISTLEWDLGRNQINEFQKQKLEKFRQEHSALTSELNGLQQ